MNRSLAALAAGAMLLASAPTLGLAEDVVDSDADSSSTSSETTTSSSFDGPEWQRPCQALNGLLKAQCIVKHNPGKGNKKDRLHRKAESTGLRLNSDCAASEGAEKVKCLRTHGKKGIKTFVRKAVKREMMRTVRGKKVEASSSSAAN